MAEAWVEIASRETLQGGRGGHPYDFGFFPAMARLIMAHPRIAPAFSQLYASIMFAEGSLDRREREMVAGVTAAAQDCFY